MTAKKFKFAAIALTAPALAMAAPMASAAPVQPGVSTHGYAHGNADVYETANHDRGRKRGWQRGRGNPHRYDRDYRYNDGYYGEPVYRDTRIWRGRDGNYYCRKEDGTTGLLIGAGVGALIGHEVAGRGDRTLGAILGAAGGAILGRAIDRSNTRCR